MLVAAILGGVLSGVISTPVEKSFARKKYRERRDNYRALPVEERQLQRQPKRPTFREIWIQVAFMTIAGAFVCAAAWSLCEFYGPRMLYAP